MGTYTVWINGYRTECSAGENLLDILSVHNFFADSFCNGNGTCGKCKVKVTSGRLSAMSGAEHRLLRPEETAKGIRLACMAEICGPVSIEFSEKEEYGRVLTKGYLPEFQRDAFDSGYGVAVDIGTTTVAAGLIDLRTGNEIASAFTLNAQRNYGMDVLTRISYEYEYQEPGIRRLQKAAIESVNRVILELCAKAELEREEISEIDAAANCIMMHMLLGADARTMGRAPYRPVFVEARTLPAGTLGLAAGQNTKLYCLPHASSFIGADVVAGMYACGMQKEEGRVLFVDIGTNGEIVLAAGGKLLSCSCAAGPALEGMNISAGMCAAEGAVEEVRIGEEGVRIKTIGGGNPAGICGSGILSAVRELLRTGILTSSGVFIQKDSLEKSDYRYEMLRLNGTKREFVLSREPEILITQRDIRQVQLAKGAVLSGIEILLTQMGITAEDLDKVFITGQFGAHLPAESLTDTGFLPKAVKDKIVYAGNSAKAGASMALLSKEIKEEMEKMAKRIAYVELSEIEEYEHVLAKCMLFA